MIKHLKTVLSSTYYQNMYHVKQINKSSE